MKGDDADAPRTDEAPSSEKPFALVGNDIRAEIVRTLGDARVEERSRPVLSFSELRSRVDADVDSSRFNYHLQRLVGHFVERVADVHQTQSDAADQKSGFSGSADPETRQTAKRSNGGYRMRPEGRTLYQTLRAGTFDRREPLSAVAAGFGCYYCGGRVEAIFEDGLATIQCPDCEYLYDVAAAPPAAIDDDEAAIEQVSQYNHHEHLAFARGVCPNCANALDTRLFPPDEVSFPGADRHEVYVYRSCDHCGGQRYLSVGEALLDDPDLIPFCYERGLDVLSTPLWEIEFAATDRDVTVRSTDPWEVALRVTLEGDALELVVDGDLTVVERNRS